MDYQDDSTIEGIASCLKGIFELSLEELERIRKTLCEFARYELLSNFSIRKEKI